LRGLLLRGGEGKGGNCYKGEGKGAKKERKGKERSRKKEEEREGEEVCSRNSQLF